MKKQKNGSKENDSFLVKLREHYLDVQEDQLLQF